MSLHVVFNDLSAAAMAVGQMAAANVLQEFGELLLDRRLGSARIFVAPDYFPQLQISTGFSVGRWLASFSPSDREKRVRLKMLIDRRKQYCDCHPAEASDGSGTDYSYRGRAAVGLSTALLVGGFAVSLWSCEEWNTATVLVEKSWIDGDDIRTASEGVPHGCRVSHLDAHAQWLHRICSLTPETGAQLWNARAILFPSLDFTESLEDQIKALGGNGPRLRLALRGLSDLQAYCESWNGGGFNIHAIPHASGESESTLNMYGDERKFRCPDGQYRIFEWHVKRNDLRIHFYPFPERRRILVGYVGPHLRISGSR